MNPEHEIVQESIEQAGKGGPADLTPSLPIHVIESLFGGETFLASIHMEPE